MPTGIAVKLVGAIGALALSQAVSAVTLYDNGAPDLVSGTQMSEFLVAENFTLGSPSDLSNLRFWTVQSGAADYSGSVYWGIYADNAGSPGALVAGGSTAATAGALAGGSTGFGYAAWVYNVPVSVSLAAGSFWLGLHNGPLSSIDPTEMLWATTASVSAPQGMYLDGVWVSTLNEHAFLIEGTVVPEPGAAVLMLAGLAAMASVARRRARG